MAEYEDFQSGIPYNTSKETGFFSVIFNHKENFALAQAAFYVATGELRKTQVIMHNTKTFTSKNNKEIAWLVLTGSVRKLQKQEEILFHPYLIPTLSYLNGMGEQDKVKNIINTLSGEEQTEMNNLLAKAADPAYYCDPVTVFASKHRHKRR